MKLDKRQTLVMTGDSITDCGRERPIGEGEGLGNGYVSLVNAVLTSQNPDSSTRVVNTGISGNTVRHLKDRWQEDVLDLRPDWVSILIGINDVWRQFDQPFNPSTHVYAEEYEQTLEDLVQTTQQLGSHVVLMSPFYIEPNSADAMRQQMNAYGRIVAKCAEQHKCIFVNLQAEFDKLLTELYPAAIARDRVHPTLSGHFVIARAFLGAIEAKI